MEEHTPDVPWKDSEVQLRQSLEQRLRSKPGDRATMIALATLLATKEEFGEALDLLQRGAIGMANDLSAHELYRKIGIGYVAVWKSMRAEPSNHASINCSDARKTHLSESASFFELGMAYPENRDFPAAMLEIAMTKMHRGQLREALDDFSKIIAEFPAMPNLNTIIFRAACLLKHLGDVEQASQYFEYVSEDPPASIGYGRLEVLALWADCLSDRGDAFKGKTARVFRLMSEAWARAQPMNAASPPGVEFRDWSEPWLLLADKVIARCDYVVAVEFLHCLLARDPSVKGYQLLGEAQYLLGNKIRALEAMGQAFRGDPNDRRVQKRLMAWDPMSWAPLIDKAAAEKLLAEEAARKEAERRERADVWGEQLHEYHLRQRRRSVLVHWHHLFTVHFAATMISRVVRGHKARLTHRELVKIKEEMEYRIRRQIRRINKHLLKNIIATWHKYWFKVSTHRTNIATPMIIRSDRRLLAAVTLSWRNRAHRQIIGKAAAKKAMRGLGNYISASECEENVNSKGRSKKLLKKAKEALVPVFYSKSLTALARFPLVKQQHEEAVARIIEARDLEAEYMADTSRLPKIKKKKKKKKEGSNSTG